MGDECAPVVTRGQGERGRVSFPSKKHRISRHAGGSGGSKNGGERPAKSPRDMDPGRWSRSIRQPCSIVWEFRGSGYKKSQGAEARQQLARERAAPKCIVCEGRRREHRRCGGRGHPLVSGSMGSRPTVRGMNGPFHSWCAGRLGTGLPVNASRPGSPQAHASLGSGWRPTLAGWDWIPTGFRARFQRSHHGILFPLTGLSRHTRCCMVRPGKAGQRGVTMR